jgi:hypothetical protein
MNKLTQEHNLSERTAAEQLAKVVEEKLGTPLYSADALRKRYARKDEDKLAKRLGHRDPSKGRPSKLQQKRKKSADADRNPGDTSRMKVVVVDPAESDQSALPTEYVDAHRCLIDLKKALLGLPCLNGREPRTVKLRNAKAGFSRTVDEYPGKPASEEDEYFWGAYFMVAEVAYHLHELQQWLYGKLPEELPENRAKRGRSKKAKS